MITQPTGSNAFAKQLRAETAQRVTALTACGRQPGLAIILVGGDLASQVCVRSEIKACENNGFLSSFDRYPANLFEADLLGHTDAPNRDPRIHGILVQLPLPKHIDNHKVLEAIAPERDTDDFHVANVGTLMTGAPLFRLCTSYDCMKILRLVNYLMYGTNAVVVGASSIVGKLMAILLLQTGVIAITCSSKTRDLATYTREADIIVAAADRRSIITADMVKPGAIVIDVGTNRDDADELCGDVGPAGVKEVAGYITPVPGGAGPMTITILLISILEAAERAVEGTALAA